VKICRHPEDEVQAFLPSSLIAALKLAFEFYQLSTDLISSMFSVSTKIQGASTPNLEKYQKRCLATTYTTKATK
jgi:hypothetical protein